MESFNFENNFEIVANYPQAEVFTKFEEYVSKKTWKIIHSSHNESISFQTRTALIAITFIANNDNSTTLSIITKTEKFDNNRSKGVVRKILKECFSEQIDNVEVEHKEVQSSNSKPEQKNKRSNSKPKYSKQQIVDNTNDNTSDFSSYINWRNIIIAVAAIIVIVVNFYPSNEETNSNSTSMSSECSSYEYNETMTSTVEAECTDIEPWMVGKWEGRITTTDYFGNPLRLHWLLEINQYGSATQITRTSNGNYDVEYFTLKYDRNQEKLYYEEGGYIVSIKVNPKTKQLYMPSSDFGTLYLNKQ